ncbi:MAG TPA: site-specific integrase [Gemmataceae bacterium]|nr:site-specific integrase [Gemmataceae bacterium]
MASLQKKGESWYCQFMYHGRRHTFTIGRVGDDEAKNTAAKCDYLLMRIKQDLLEVPADMDICTFLQHDGRPLDRPGKLRGQQIQFSEFSDSYLKTFSGGAIEESTLYTARIHLNHLSQTLGPGFPMNSLTLPDLQRHVTRRQKNVAGITVKKEIDTLRSAWRWAQRMDLVEGDFPNGGLVYPKADEKLPFMTWAEIERRIDAGGDPEQLWECLYLTDVQIKELLADVKNRKVSAWIYPMFLTIAHTGARRSEMIRSKAEDVDFAGGTITIREKKRVKGTRTTRRVPLSGPLLAMLRKWLPGRVGKPFLFGPGMKPMTPQAAQHAFARTLADTKWKVLKGYHVLRHSFISALASRGVDQRIVDDFVGHQTEEQRRRYRHLYPSTQKQAIKQVFG